MQRLLPIVTLMPALLGLWITACKSHPTPDPATYGLPTIKDGKSVIVPCPVNHEEAIKTVSQLQVGMKQQEVERFLATKWLRPYCASGGSAHWFSDYALNDNTSLRIFYGRDADGTNQLHDGRLDGAWIQSTNHLEGATTIDIENLGLHINQRFYQKRIPLLPEKTQ